ncbi:MAG: acyl-CoA thioesterase, partial [SAR324 cluster bacterium]|nr:acyl-CoA thioesterase [SAR324 cluster bacterium]
MIDPRLEATVEIEIPFHDVDSIHMVWHGNHIKYFEIARTALTRLFNYDVAEMAASGIMWPIIECNCRYINSISYGDIILVRAWVSEVEHRFKV